MHLDRRDNLSAKGQIFRGAGVSDDQALVTQINCGAHACIQAHMGHHSAYDKALDVQLLQMRVEQRPSKAVGELFFDNGLTRQGLNSRVYFCSGCSRYEKACPWPLGNVLNIYNRPAFMAEKFQEESRLASSGWAVYEGVFSTWKIIVLQVDNQQSGVQWMIRKYSERFPARPR